MPANYFDAPGDVISKCDLKISKAQEVVTVIEKLPYFTLCELRKLSNGSEAEVVVLDAEIEVGQVTIHDIRWSERIAIIFFAKDESFPEVLTLREDFPKVPHLNLREQEKPRSLCLFDEKYSEFKLLWTPTLFLERIREWLSLTAKGKLHTEDQPLEPLLMGSPMHLIIPSDLFSQKGSVNRDLLVIRRSDYGENRTTFVAEWIENVSLQKGEIKYVAIDIQGVPQIHGIINRQPENLLELHEFLRRANIDLLLELRKRIYGFNERKEYKNLLGAKIVLIFEFPKKRSIDAPPEASDIWAFLTHDTIKNIGIEIGLWEPRGGELGFLIPPDPTKKGDKIGVALLNPSPSFSRDVASKMNGIVQDGKKEILLIGGGSLGSQIFINLIRSGFGKWTIIDEDCLLPHNLARHTLPGFCLGYSKAEALANYANNIIDGELIAEAIVADVLNPLNSLEKLRSKYSEVQVIIDTSASIAVARHLVHDIDSVARRISIFLNPSGSDVVILAEDEDRKFKLDCLEMQYYRCLINEPTIENHLKLNDGSIRYARSCRDISAVIPQDLVALHSAICSRGIRNLLLKASAGISIWEINLDDISVKSRYYSAYKTFENKFGDWTLYCDSWLLDKISQARIERLPNETGGVLVGSLDMQRKIVYVVDTVLSPSDSQEWPTVYIRGCKGLKSKIDKIKETTLGKLDYVGEWHSHPVGCGTEPSEDDCKAFIWLVDTMDVYGKPALMLIAGEQKHSWYLGRMK